MRCAYCHNPDTWDMDGGELMEAGDIIERMQRNIEFYTSGGLTATGGEPLAQMDFLTELFTLAKQKGIHTTLDTSGITFTEDVKDKFDKLMKVTDLVMLDIKHMDPKAHIELTGQKSDNVFAFAEYLKENDIPVWIRHVVVPGITFDEKELTALGKYLKTLTNLKKLEVLPYHSMGKVKYDNLGLKYKLEDTLQLTKDEAKQAEEIIRKAM